MNSIQELRLTGKMLRLVVSVHVFPVYMWACTGFSGFLSTTKKHASGFSFIKMNCLMYEYGLAVRHFIPDSLLGFMASGTG